MHSYQHKDSIPATQVQPMSTMQATITGIQTKFDSYEWNVEGSFETA